MKRHGWKLRVGLAAWLVMAALGVNRATAAPLDDRIPGDALVYVGWQGADALAGDYANSNLKGIVDASGAGAYIAQQLETLQAKAAEEGNAGDVAMAKTCLRILWQHPGAFYAGPVDFPGRQVAEGTTIPGFHFALLSQAGDDAKTLEDDLNLAIRKYPAPPELQMHVVMDRGNVVIITWGDMHARVPDPGFLADLPAYKNAMPHVDADGAVVLYVNGKGILDTVKDGLNKTPDVPADAQRIIPAVLEGLGLDELREMAYSGKFDKKNWRELSFVATSGERKGILALIAGEPVSDGLLQLVPADAAVMSASRLDLTKVLAMVRDIAGRIDPQAVANIDKGLAMADAQLGFDIEKDFIEPLGDEWAYYRAPTGGPTLSLTVVQRPRDEKTLANTLTTLEDLINAKGGGAGQVSVDKVDGGNGIEFSALRTPQFSLAWALRNGVLYISNIDGAAAAIQQVEQKKPSITTNPAFIAALSALPMQKGMTVEYGDPAKVYPEIQRAIGMISPLLALKGIHLPADLLPDPDKIAPYMTPGADVAWSDANGFYSASETAFPGAAVITGQQGTTIGVAALATSLLLPSLGRSRELATRSMDGANARGICQAANVWAADNNNAMPDHLARLLMSNMISPKQLVNKRGPTTPLDMTPQMLDKAQSDYDAFTREVDAHCDWVYLGKGTTADVDSTVVLIYEKPAPYVTDGLTIGFQDGHAEFVRWSGLRDIFDATNAYLKKKGLPEVDVDAILKAVPPAGQRQIAPAASMP